MSTTRAHWIKTMAGIARPVLEALANEKLSETLPRDLNPPRAPFACLEAFGRTVCGIAPWLEAEGLEGEEAVLQQQFRALVRAGIDHATDSRSPDFMQFSSGGQPLVDTAFLAHGILRAPKQLYETLDDRVKKNLAAALASSRAITPSRNNWLFFSAMVESALLLMGEKVDRDVLSRAFECFDEDWYMGDGVYSDGPRYHWDYYNSFVIQPMFVDVLRTWAPHDEECAALLPKILRRATRYAEILERLIAPDGSYPVVGRSIIYRFGAFQLLSQAALQKFLPAAVSPAQVRCALTAVINRCISAPGTFDEKGFLRPGVCGYQPVLAEGYINIGSLYLCSTVFLPLGLSPAHPFWSAPDAAWSAKKVWSGEQIVIDHAAE